MDYIYGKKPIENIILNFSLKVKKIYLQKGIAFSPDIYKIIKEKNILWVSLEKKDLNKIIKEKVVHQGFIAEVTKFEFTHIKDIFLSTNKNQVLLMLDRIQDPYNFGSIIRSASLFGVDGIIIQEHNQVDITPIVFKASAGTIYNVPIIKVSNLSNAINALKQNGFWIYATSLADDAKNLTEISFEKKSLIIIGNEGDGIMKKIINKSDLVVKIKTKQNIDSLNVSVATGILLFKAFTN